MNKVEKFHQVVDSFLREAHASQQNKRLIDEHLVHYIIEHNLLGGDVHK